MVIRKSPIGCRRDAQAAVDGRLRMAGSGISRQVYVDERERVVYKVNLDDIKQYQPRADRWDANTDEHETAQRLRRRGFSWAPPTYLYQIDDCVVLAMPYYPVSSGDAPYSVQLRVADEIEPIVPDDFHDGNWRLTRNFRPRVIDLAV